MRLGMVIDANGQLGIAGSMGANLAKYTEAVTDLGDLEIVAVDEQTQTHFGGMSCFRRTNHG